MSIKLKLREYLKARPNVVFEAPWAHNRGEAIYVTYTRGNLHKVIGLGFGLYPTSDKLTEYTWKKSTQTVESLGFSNER